MIAKPKPEPTPVLDIANEEKTREWNESISPRLESMRSWFNSDEWSKGLRSYLGSVLQKRREHLESHSNDERADQFIKGQIAMLKEIMAIPIYIEKQIAQIESRKNMGPTGNAGY